MMDTDRRLAAVAVVRAVVGATDTESPIAERVMHSTALDALFDTLSHAEVEQVCRQLASFMIGISSTADYPLVYLLDGLRAEAVEQLLRG